MFRAPDRQFTARRAAHPGQKRRNHHYPRHYHLMHAPNIYCLLRGRLVETRERATVVSSVTQEERQQDIAREQQRLEKERARLAASTSHYRGVTSPRMPKRGNVAPTASGSHYLHVAGSPRGGYLYSPSPGAGLYQHLLTPQARQVGRPSPAAGSSKNPPTPLDSLVYVALNMYGRGQSTESEENESPLQKLGDV